MAGKNQVTLTFAGDSTSLERSFEKVGAGAKQAEEDIERVGTASTHLSDRTRKASKDTQEYASRLDRAGEAGGNAESQFLGLGAGISGVSTLMRGGSLSAEEMAMGVADIGDSIEHTVVPWLQKGKEGVLNFIDSLGGMKNAAVLAGGAAGLGLLAAGLIALDAKNHEREINDMTDAVDHFGGAVNDQTKAVFFLSGIFGDLDEVMGKVIEANPEAAATVLENAAAFNISAEDAEKYREQLEEVAGSAESVTFAINDLNDAYKAQFDPVFAATEAASALRDANNEVARALREEGEESSAYRDASLDAASAAANLESAQLALQEAVANGDVSLGSLNATLTRWADQGLIARDSIDETREAILAQTDAARQVPGRVDTTLFAHDRALPTIRSVEGAVEDLDGMSATVVLEAVGNLGRAIGALFAAEGGIVPQYLAHGGVGGPRGTDTIPAWLTPGELILNEAQQAALAPRLDRSGSSVTVVVQGSVLSERDLVGVIRNELRRGGFGGAR